MSLDQQQTFTELVNENNAMRAELSRLRAENEEFRRRSNLPSLVQEKELLSLRAELTALRSASLSPVFSVAELAELCSATGDVGAISEELRAKLVQMWNEQSRAALRLSQDSTQ